VMFGMNSDGTDERAIQGVGDAKQNSQQKKKKAAVRENVW